MANTTNIYIGSGGRFTALGSDLRVNGTNKGVETVVITPDLGPKYAETHDVVVTKTVEILDLSLLEDATYQSAGNSLKVFDAAGETLITQIFMQSDGTEIILPGQTKLSLAKLASGVISIDGKALSTDAPGPLPHDIVVINANAGDAYNAHGEDIIFEVQPGDYEYTITGFGAGDVLIFPKDSAPAVENDDSPGLDVSLTTDDGASQSAALLHLEGVRLSSGQSEFDLMDITDFNAVFGQGTVIIGEIDSAKPVIISGQKFTYPEGSPLGAELGKVAATDNVGVEGFQIVAAKDADGNVLDLSETQYFAIDARGNITLTKQGEGSVANDYEVGPRAFTLTVTTVDAAKNKSLPVDVMLSMKDIADEEEGAVIVSEDVENSASTPYDASTSDVKFVLKFGDYDYYITGFGEGDALDFPQGEIESPALENKYLGNGRVSLFWEEPGSSIRVHLVGLDAEVESTLFDASDFTGAFGAGAIS